jgi:hypothetical protein
MRKRANEADTARRWTAGAASIACLANVGWLYIWATASFKHAVPEFVFYFLALPALLVAWYCANIVEGLIWAPQPKRDD